MIKMKIPLGCCKLYAKRSIPWDTGVGSEACAYI